MKLIYRPIVGKIKKQVDKGNVVILIGARQVGKTSILRLLMGEIERSKPKVGIFYFDLEKEELLEIFQSYRTLIDWLKLQGADLGKENYLFIDEFHYIPHPTKIFKIIHDDFPNLKIVATSSSSLEISSKIKETLTGRKRIFRIHPLSFEEFLKFKKSPQRDIFLRLRDSRLKLVEPVLGEFIKEWEEFLLFGGYPKVALTLGEEEKAGELEEIYNSYVQKDIKAFLKIENVLAFNRLVKILAVQIANLANLSQIGSPLKIARETLERYVFVLENTFIIKTLSPFFTNKTKEITKMGKIFFCDVGLRNFSIKDFKRLELRLDKGALVENIVATELIKSASVFQDLHFWRTQAKTEVDFILASKGNIIPIEVKYQSFKASKIPSGLKAFIENYKPEKAFVLTKNFTDKVNFQHCEIRFLPAFLCSTLM
ncbi:ATP-binding protein [Thermodesulfovibrionales bacterium]|nr:ATP-binding protein [Thermodesulfovibrionales bacterium]